MSANKPLPPKEEIKVWIKRNGGREKIGKLIGSEKSTVDSWFSNRDIPEDKHEAIARLMAASAASFPDAIGDADSTSLIRVPFTDEQLQRTTRAASLTGVDFQEYCQKAITSQVTTDLGKILSPHDHLTGPSKLIQPLESARPVRPPLRFELPCLGALAAGTGNFGDDLETVMVSKEYPKGCFALRVLGDSMDSGGPDAIPDGSIAIFKPMPQGAYAAKGKIYAFATPDGDVIKKFSRANGGQLISLNPSHPPIPYSEEMKACGEFLAVEAQ
jgi:hypothetical protein